MKSVVIKDTFEKETGALPFLERLVFDIILYLDNFTQKSNCLFLLALCFLV